MSDCQHYATNRPCPIAGAPCPGECVFADMLRNMNTGIIVLDLKGQTLVFVNSEARSLFESKIPMDDYAAVRKLVLEDQEILESQTARTLEIGHQIIGYSTYVMSEFVWVFARDITAKTRVDSIAEAVNIVTNTGYIFSGIRHELGNPVNSIKMALSVLRENLDTFPRESIERYIDRCLADLSRVEYLLRNLKSFNMFEDLEIQTVSLTDFLDRLEALVGDDMNRRGVEVELNFGEVDCEVSIDPRAMQQVLLNLVTNAADAVSGQAMAKIQIRLCKRDGQIDIEVIDNGPGIEASELVEIFKPFYTNKENGTGLGLPLARRMLARMNCQIEIKSSVTKGTTAVVSVPCEPDPAELQSLVANK